MAFLPLNLLLVLILAAFFIWAWDGELVRQVFGLFSAIFMLPMWLNPLYSIVDTGTCCTIVRTTGWLPTFIFGTIVFWNVILMYAANAHILQTLDRDPLFRRRKRKPL